MSRHATISEPFAGVVAAPARAFFFFLGANLEQFGEHPWSIIASAKYRVEPHRKKQPQHLVEAIPLRLRLLRRQHAIHRVAEPLYRERPLLRRQMRRLQRNRVEGRELRDPPDARLDHLANHLRMQRLPLVGRHVGTDREERDLRWNTKVSCFFSEDGPD